MSVTNDLEPQRPTAPLHTTPAGWYLANGELRWWNGQAWTEHRQPAHLADPARQGFPTQSGYAGVMTDSRTSGVEVAIARVLTLLTLGYLLPWAVAATRGKSNSLAIGLLNFFLGWTFLSWIAAMVLACMAHQVAAIRHYL